MIDEAGLERLQSEHGGADVQAARLGSTARCESDAINSSMEFLAAYLAERGFPVKQFRRRDGGTDVLILSRCPMNADHGGGTDTAVILHPNGKIGFACQHNSCREITWTHVRAKIDPEFESRRSDRLARQNEPDPVISIDASVSPSTPPWSPFPSEVLPEPVRDYIRAAAQAIGCDEALIAAPALAVLSAAIGATRTIQLKRSWQEPAAVWLVAVAESGQHKSPALEKVIDPFRSIQRDKLEMHRRALEQHEEAMRWYEAELVNWRKGDHKTEPPPKPKAPIDARIFVSDITLEDLATKLQYSDKLLVFRDEMSGWFGSHDRYTAGKRGDAAGWLELHRMGTLVVDRKTSENRTIYVPRAMVSILGSTQPEMLRRLLGGEHLDNGLAARFLMVMPPAQPRVWREDDVDEETQARYFATIQRLLDLAKRLNPRDGSPEAVNLSMTTDARKQWIAFYNRFATEMSTATRHLAAAYSKLEGYAARFALILQLTRDPEATMIDVAAMNAGIRLAEWFRDEAARVYALLTETRDGRELRALQDWIKSRGGRVTARNLQRNLRRYGRAGGADAAEADLQALVDAGEGEWFENPVGESGGRPTAVFALKSRVPPTPTNPKLELSVDAYRADETPDLGQGNGVSSASALTLYQPDGGFVGTG